MNKKRNRGVTLTEQERRKLLAAKARTLSATGEKMTYERIAENAELSTSTVKRFFQRSYVDEASAISIIELLDLNPSEIHLIKSKDNHQSRNDNATASDCFYVERPPIENQCKNLVQRPACLLRIKGPQGFGKTSLLTHILQEFQNQESKNNEHYKTVYVPFEELNDSGHLKDLRSCLSFFCQRIASDLKMTSQSEKINKITGIFECKNYFENEILSQIDSSLVVALDSIDTIFSCSIATEFLGMLRSWHEQAKIYPVWKKLRLILAYSTDAYIPINAKSSPFNVGDPIDLREFNDKEIHQLAKLNEIEWENEEVDSLMDMIGGLPNLVTRAIHEYPVRNQSINELLSEAELPSGIYYNHLTQLREKIEPYPELVMAMKNVIKGQGIKGGSFAEQELHFKLYSMGLVKVQHKYIVPRCKLYQQYFSNWNMNHD